MAQKRMIDKKISVSEQVANLPLEAQLIFTWAIPHADDVGLLPSSHRTLKAIIAPLLEMRSEDFTGHWDAIIGQGLVQEFEYKGEKFYRITKFNDHQTLKSDRQPQTILDIKLSKSPKESWDMVNSILEDNGIHLDPSGIHLDTEVKRREVKRRKEKREEASPRTPAFENNDFFNEGETYQLLLSDFSQKISPPLVEKEFRKFILYWTEPNSTGQKLRWQQQPTFDVKRRLYTWFTRVKDSGAREISKGRGIA